MRNFARQTAAESVKTKRCNPAQGMMPGCGKEIDPFKEFKDETSAREYMISGMCQSCQDNFYDNL